MPKKIFIVFISLIATSVYCQQADTTRLRDVNHYRNVENYVREGEYGDYYKDGQLRQSSTYKNNKRHGVHKMFYRDGTPKRIENYFEGKMTDGKCFDKNGTEIPFFEMEANPEFPGGKQELYKFIAKNFNPKLRGSGKIIVSFIIGAEGFVVQPMIKKGISKSLDEEALRVVKTLPQWKPGMQDGIPIRAEYSLPITIQND